MLLAVFVGFWPGGRAQAHGSLPISQQILWRGDTMLVPVAYWGIFIGTDGGPWRWICEESISTYMSRSIALGTDGTIYATDFNGLMVSRDNGCSWTPATSTVASLIVVGLASDPQTPRIWALANNTDGTGNGLLASDDTGRTWQTVYATPAHLPSGLLLSKDGQTMIIGSVTNALPRQPVLHRSSDGGKTFSTQTLTYQIDGMPLTFYTPLWVDSQPPGHVFLSVKLDTANVALEVDGAGNVVEVLRTAGQIYAMERAPNGDTLIGTGKGIYASHSGGPYTMLNTLGSAQCLSTHSGTLYGCGWNYLPDSAAIARLSNDAMSFTKVFRFDETQSPIDCPAGTQVANICPSYWATYAGQLGVNLGGQLDGGTQTPGSGGSCSYSQRPPSGAGLWLWGIGLAALALSRRRAAGSLSDRRA